MLVISLLTIDFILSLTAFRFEKSLYDLIKGLRNHKGAEEDYIQSSLRECRAEIRTQDMGTLATGKIFQSFYFIPPPLC